MNYKPTVLTGERSSYPAGFPADNEMNSFPGLGVGACPGKIDEMN